MVVALTVVVGLVIGCGSTARDAEGVLPVHRDQAALMTAEIAGVVVRDGTCVLVDQLPGLVLPVWPADTRLEGDNLLRAGTAVATVGAPVELSGGFLPYDALRQTMDTDITEACRIGNYFLVNGTAGPCLPTLVPDRLGRERLVCGVGHFGQGRDRPRSAPG